MFTIYFNREGADVLTTTDIDNIAENFNRNVFNLENSGGSTDGVVTFRRRAAIYLLAIEENEDLDFGPSLQPRSVLPADEDPTLNAVYLNSVGSESL